MISICETTRWVDGELAAISRELKMLYYLNPVNSDDQRARFFAKKGSWQPRFRYKRLDFDRDLVRRNLYELPIEGIADPLLQDLYRKKRWEIDNQLSLLDERGSDNLTLTSEKLYGGVDAQAVRDAHEILEMDPEPETRTVSAERVKRMLEQVVASYSRKAGEPFDCKVRLRRHLSSNAAAGERSVALKTQSRYSLNDARIYGVHEVGWHVLTANNGGRQPLQIFAIGLPGFLGAQEGAAIFAEYMAGALTVNRLRIIAGRTLAVSLALEGWPFSETYDYLMRMPHGFHRLDAFTICERAYRGGAADRSGRWHGVYTKDAIYQRDFVRVFTWWRSGLDLSVLSAGKMDLEHVGWVGQAIAEGDLLPPAFLPAFVADVDNLKLRQIVFSLLTRRPSPDAPDAAAAWPPPPPAMVTPAPGPIPPAPPRTPTSPPQKKRTKKAPAAGKAKASSAAGKAKASSAAGKAKRAGKHKPGGGRG